MRAMRDITFLAIIEAGPGRRRAGPEAGPQAGRAGPQAGRKPEAGPQAGSRKPGRRRAAGNILRAV